MDTDTPQTFGPLWKLYMRNVPLAATAPPIGAPKTASSSLVRQATVKLLKGQNRKAVLQQLVTSTMRKPAAVVPAGQAAPSPSAVSTASPAPAAAPPAGFGGAGYSGANATSLGAASNPGWATASTPQPKP